MVNKTKTSKKTSANKSKQPHNQSSNQENALVYEIIVLSFFAFSLLLFLSVYSNKAGAFGHFISNVFFGLFGISVYLLPIVALIASFFKIFNKGNNWLNRRIYFGASLIVTLSIFAHIINLSSPQINKSLFGKSATFSSLINYYTISAESRIAGGFIGGLFGDILMILVGRIGSFILVTLLAISLTMLLTDMSLVNIMNTIGKLFKNILKKYNDIIDGRNTNKSELQGTLINNKYTDINSKVAESNSIGEMTFSIDNELVQQTISEEVIGPNTDVQKIKRETQKHEELKEEISIVSNQKDYEFPSIDFLKKNPFSGSRSSQKTIVKNAEKLEQILKSFGVRAKVLNVSCGPTVTRYELQPEQGVKVSRIVGLSDDIALNFATSGIRIEAPIPGKSAIGIEVPNKEISSVFLREVLDSEEFKKFPSKVAIALGKDIAGQVIVADIGRMPHILIAGATGSGKSVCINTLIMSLIYKSTPKEVRLLLIDPKVVELSIYNGIPHLLIPVVTDPRKAAGALNWAVSEMADRYKLFAATNVRDLKGYNRAIRDDEEKDILPQIVIIVDELADLMMASPKDVEDAICRLAQMARAAGIHLIIATQRPSVDVITGLIKANIPSRIAFSVSSGIDSRTIIDMNGAEKLLGKGDMLFYPVGLQKPLRVQGAFISDKEVENIVEFLKDSQKAIYNEKIINQITSNKKLDSKKNDLDEYYQDALEMVIDNQKASASMIQRKFRVGYNRAARIVDQLYDSGIVGSEEGSRPRKVLITKNEYEQMKKNIEEGISTENED